MKTLFLGYGVPKDLDLKYKMAIPAFDKAGFKQIERQGDMVHLIPYGEEMKAVRIVKAINRKHRTDITMDFEDIKEEQLWGCELDKLQEWP